MFNRLFRQKPEKTIKYNDTSDYCYMEVTGIMGAFTSQPIDPGTLPDGYQAFSLIGTPVFERIVPYGKRKGDGIFICKDGQAQALGHGRGRLNPEDSILQENSAFDFQAFFGQKLSIDCMITLAEEKKLQQLQSSGKAQDTRQNSDF